jgi:protein-tyrosine phosphatase
MVDIHSHILYGVDDGAATLQESLDMLRLAAASGTTDIVATPHANSEYSFDPQRNSALRDEIIAAAASDSIPIPRIHLACDFHLAAGNIDAALQAPKRFTVNSGSYLMVEFPELFNPPAMDEVLRQLSAISIIPVITHPERNPVLQKSPDILARWISRGCRSQLTAMSLTGGFGTEIRTAAWQFLRAGHAHIVASDGHNTHRRPPCLDAVHSLLVKEIGSDLAALLLVDHPRAVIDNLDIPMECKPLSESRKWYQFW